MKKILCVWLCLPVFFLVSCINPAEEPVYIPLEKSLTVFVGTKTSGTIENLDLRPSLGMIPITFEETAIDRSTVKWYFTVDGTEPSEFSTPVTPYNYTLETTNPRFVSSFEPIRVRVLAKAGDLQATADVTITPLNISVKPESSVLLKTGRSYFVSYYFGMFDSTTVCTFFSIDAPGTLKYEIDNVSLGSASVDYKSAPSTPWTLGISATTPVVAGGEIRINHKPGTQYYLSRSNECTVTVSLE